MKSTYIDNSRACFLRGLAGLNVALLLQQLRLFPIGVLPRRASALKSVLVHLDKFGNATLSRLEVACLVQMPLP
jgi:hypothetical protein